MENTVFRSEYGLAYIRVLAIHSVIYYLGFAGCMRYSLTLVEVERRTYAVAIVAA